MIFTFLWLNFTTAQRLVGQSILIRKKNRCNNITEIQGVFVTGITIFTYYLVHDFECWGIQRGEYERKLWFNVETTPKLHLQMLRLVLS